MYGTFEGYVVTFKGNEVTSTGTRYQSATVETSGGRRNAMKVEVPVFLVEAFENGWRGKYFFARPRDARPGSLSSIFVYAVITEDGRHIFEREIFEEIEYEVNQLAKKQNKVMMFFIGIGILTIPVLVGFYVLLKIAMVWRMQSKLYHSVSHFHDLKQIESELAAGGFDLGSIKN